MSQDTVAAEPRKWYLIYSKPRAEELAATHLSRQEYVHYLPLITATRTHKGRLLNRIEPMFPRYLFISLDTKNDNWAPIRSTIGVSSLVKFGNQPAVVPTELVEALRSRENADGMLSLPARNFDKGDHVRIFDGPFKDYEGIFLARNSNERVIILLDILGKASRVAIKSTNLVKVL